MRSYPDYESLFNFFESRNKLFYKLERLNIIPDKQLRICSYCGKNEKMYCIQELANIENLITIEISKIYSRNIGYGFIYCDSIDTAQMLIKSNTSLILKLAPCDSDIIWHNIKQDKGLSLFKRIFTNVIFILLFFVLFTPLALSSLISQIMSDLSLNMSFVSETLSSFVLSLFQYIIVPYVIRFLTEQELHHLKSEVASSRIFKYLLYIIMNIIIFPLIGAITLTVFVQQMIDVEIFEWSINLSRNVAKVGEFFMKFVISMGFVSNILDLLALSSYFVGKVSEWQAATSIEEHKASLAPEFDFAHEYSKILTVFAVTLIFSISTPLILPFGAVYMFIKYSVDKYSLLFAYRIGKNESLSIQRTVITCLLIIVSLFQSINSGIFIVSGTSILIWLGGILNTLSIVTLLFSLLLYKYWDLAQNLNLSKFWKFNYRFDDRFKHPCETILEDYIRKSSIL